MVQDVVISSIILIAFFISKKIVRGVTQAENAAKEMADGNFDDANIYVAMYDADYKPVMVNGKVDNKMKGSEIVDYIRRNLGM